jgi:hypothetical protein
VRLGAATLALSLLGACRGSEGAAPHGLPTASFARTADPPASSPDAASPSEGVNAAAEPAHALPKLGPGEVEAALFLDAAGTPQSPAMACPEADTDNSRVRCMLARKYAGDDEARSLAESLWTETGSVAGVERAHTMDGGFRGLLHIVPEPPVGPYRAHLAWVLGALRDFAALWEALTAATPGKTPQYRYRALTFRFFRSVGRTTPSAYASGWTVAYNVSGSLLKSETSVRETLFHEVFHLNDASHGDWSTHALRTDFDGIVRRCGTSMPCLAPYSPSDTVVRGGTYYAFQPNNGDAVREYAAELALRWYREHRATMRGERLAKPPFKCGPPENARAWAAIVAEFFAGIDQTPACGTHR